MNNNQNQRKLNPLPQNEGVVTLTLKKASEEEIDEPALSILSRSKTFEKHLKIEACICSPKVLFEDTLIIDTYTIHSGMSKRNLIHNLKTCPPSINRTQMEV